MKTEISFQDAFYVFARTLRKDKGLYIAYQANIAMSVMDAITNDGIRFPQLQILCNKGAKNFLNMLIKKANKE